MNGSHKSSQQKDNCHKFYQRTQYSVPIRILHVAILQCFSQK